MERGVLYTSETLEMTNMQQNGTKRVVVTSNDNHSVFQRFKEKVQGSKRD